jgi:hypothetical protein
MPFVLHMLIYKSLVEKILEIKVAKCFESPLSRKYSFTLSRKNICIMSLGSEAESVCYHLQLAVTYKVPVCLNI